MNKTSNDGVRELITRIVQANSGITLSQIMAQIQADAHANRKIPPHSRVVEQACYGARKRGDIVRTMDLAIKLYRYYMPTVRYRWRNILDVYIVERLHPNIPDHWNNISNGMTESEARTCVTALNTLDSKIRATHH